MKNFKRVFLGLFLAITLSGCTKTTTTILRTAPNYQHTIVTAHNIVSLPPRAEVNSIDAGGKATRKYDYEDQIEHMITEVLVEKFHEKGYKIKPITKRQIHDLKLSRKVLAFQEEYQRQIDTLYNPLFWEEQKAFAIESLINTDTTEIKAATEADLVMFAEYYARIKTSGANIKDIFFGNNSSIDPRDLPEFISLRVAIVDMSNNKIVWSNIENGGYDFFTFDSSEKVDRKRLNELLNVILAKLPPK